MDLFSICSSLTLCTHRQKLSEFILFYRQYLLPLFKCFPFPSSSYPISTPLLASHSLLPTFSSLQPLSESQVAPRGCRYDGQIAVYGEDIQSKLGALNVFLVGAGAIG